MTNKQFFLEHIVSPSFLKGYLKLAYQGGLSFKDDHMNITVTKIRNLKCTSLTVMKIISITKSRLLKS